MIIRRILSADFTIRQLSHTYLVSDAICLSISGFVTDEAFSLSFESGIR